MRSGTATLLVALNSLGGNAVGHHLPNQTRKNLLHSQHYKAHNFTKENIPYRC